MFLNREWWATAKRCERMTPTSDSQAVESHRHYMNYLSVDTPNIFQYKEASKSKSVSGRWTTRPRRVILNNWANLTSMNSPTMAAIYLSQTAWYFTSPQQFKVTLAIWLCKYVELELPKDTRHICGSHFAITQTDTDAGKHTLLKCINLLIIQSVTISRFLVNKCASSSLISTSNRSEFSPWWNLLKFNPPWADYWMLPFTNQTIHLPTSPLPLSHGWTRL